MDAVSDIQREVSKHMSCDTDLSFQ